MEDPSNSVHNQKSPSLNEKSASTRLPQNAEEHARQAPDVILIGEIRDTETMEAVITFAETGHLFDRYLAPNNANQAIERIMNFFPSNGTRKSIPTRSTSARSSHNGSCPRTGGCPLEIMMDTLRVKDLIKKAEVDTPKAMEQGIDEGCQTSTTSLAAVQGKQNSAEQALINATAPPTRA